MYTNVYCTGVKYNQLDTGDLPHELALKQNKAALKGMTADDIPNLIPKAALQEWQKGDDNPYYKLQAIDYPIKANGYTYQESFFESFLNGLKEYPYPGSKYGHERDYLKRDKTHLILVGGMLQKKSNGKGTVFLKNYIPPETEDGSNATFIKELKTGMVEFSLVAWTRDEEVPLKDGITQVNVVEYLRGGRNDAVGRHEGAMEQKVAKKLNAQRIMQASVRNARSLISQGKVNKTSSWSFSGADGNALLGSNDNWSNYAKWHMIEDTDAETETKARYKYPYGKGGQVYLSALRAIASRAGQQGLDELSNIASKMIDDINEKDNSGGAGDDINTTKGIPMTKEEILAAIKQSKTNNIETEEILKLLGDDREFIGDKHKNALAVIQALEEMDCKDPVKEIKSLRDEIKKNSDAVLDAKLQQVFGTESDDNLLLSYARKMYNGAEGKTVDEKISAIKADPVAQKLAGEKADYTKQPLGVVEPSKNKDTDKPAPPVDGIGHVTL